MLFHAELVIHGCFLEKLHWNILQYSYENTYDKVLFMVKLEKKNTSCEIFQDTLLMENLRRQMNLFVRAVMPHFE